MLQRAIRNQQLAIDLDIDKYAVSNNQFKIISKTDFGFFSAGGELLYFNGNTNKASLKVATISNSELALDIKKWGADEISFTQSSKDVTSNKLVYQINDLKHNRYYTILINNKTTERIKSNIEGTLVFKYKTNKNPDEIVVLNK